MIVMLIEVFTGTIGRNKIEVRYKKSIYGIHGNIAVFQLQQDSTDNHAISAKLPRQHTRASKTSIIGRSKDKKKAA